MDSWQNVSDLYDSMKHQLQSRFPGQYYLVHVESGLAEFGSPSKGDEDGSRDAWSKHNARHGKIYGDYFAVIIPR